MFTGDFSVFIVFTKYDLVRHDKEQMAEFERTKDRLAGLFSLQGEMRNNSIEWVNYTDENTCPCPEIEKQTFVFLEKLLLHLYRQHTEDIIKSTCTDYSIPDVSREMRVLFKIVKLFKDCYNNGFGLNISGILTAVVLLMAVGVLSYLLK